MGDYGFWTWNILTNLYWNPTEQLEEVELKEVRKSIPQLEVSEIEKRGYLPGDYVILKGGRDGTIQEIYCNTATVWTGYETRTVESGDIVAGNASNKANWI